MSNYAFLKRLVDLPEDAFDAEHEEVKQKAEAFEKQSRQANHVADLYSIAWWKRLKKRGAEQRAREEEAIRTTPGAWQCRSCQRWLMKHWEVCPCVLD